MGQNGAPTFPKTSSKIQTLGSNRGFLGRSRACNWYHAPRGNVTQGGANLAQLTMTAQFYRQDALTRPNLTQRGPNLAQIYVTLQ